MGELTIYSEATGPAMAKLTPKQRAFVIARVWKGYRLTDAAADAGYSPSGNRDSLAVTGHNLAKHPHVAAACREETEKMRDSEGANSFRTLITIRDDPTVEPQHRLRAATELLNRSGWHPATEHTLHVTHAEEPAEEKVKRIRLMCESMGIDAEKVLGYCRVEEAEFEDVTPPEPTEEEKQEAARRERENELRRARRAMTPEQLAKHKAAMRAEKSERFKAGYRQATGDTPDAEQPVAITPVDDDLSDIY